MISEHSIKYDYNAAQRGFLMNVKSSKKSIMYRWFAMLLVTVILFAAYGNIDSSAASSEPMAQLKVSVDEIVDILKRGELKRPEKHDERQRLIWDVALKMFDFREMAKRSLGKNWNTITSEERDRFVKLFSSLVKKRYIGKINDYTDQEIVYTKQLIKKDRAIVYSLIIDKGTKIPIIYKLKADQEKWFIYDMKIENVSMVLNYRRDFDSVIRKEKFAGLLERITEQLEKKQDSP
jgi:phospholipid transport system substrate-binding protein